MSEARLITIDRDFLNNITSLGGVGINKCYQCGTCTAICPISDTLSISFRKTIKYTQLGLKEKVLSDVTPWLCYACGECSETCPKDAKPGEIMAALRRYLTLKYDWTGFSKLLYLSKKAEIISVIILSLITAFIIYLLKGPVILTTTKLKIFAPPYIVAWSNLIVFAILSIILIISIYRSYKMVMSDVFPKPKIPLKTYIIEFIKIIPTHFFTQKLRTLCRKRESYYIIHLLLFYGYAVIFLHHITRHMLIPLIAPTIHPDELISRIIGLSAFCALFIGSSIAIYGRSVKSQVHWSYSHSTDWMFIILLWLTSITGLLIEVFRYFNLPLPTYIVFSLHLMFVVPLLVLEVPFAKWSHLAYRPFAIYFFRLKEAALRLNGGGRI